MKNEITEAMVEAAVKAVDIDLFSSDEHVAHRAASPWKVDFARGRACDFMRAALSAALNAADVQEPVAWQTQRYERGLWVETNLHLTEPTATDDLVVIPLYAAHPSPPRTEALEARRRALEEAALATGRVATMFQGKSDATSGASEQRVYYLLAEIVADVQSAIRALIQKEGR